MSANPSLYPSAQNPGMQTTTVSCKYLSHKDLEGAYLTLTKMSDICTIFMTNRTEHDYNRDHS
jgi:hypothetical protein